MEIFVNNHMEDGGDLTEAHRRLDFLHTRKGTLSYIFGYKTEVSPL